MTTQEIFKVLSKIVSKDAHRYAITHIHVAKNGTVFEATDGHRAIRVTLPIGHGAVCLADGLYVPKTALLLMKAGQTPAPTGESGFPDFDQVIPARRSVENGDLAAPCVAFDPAILSSTLAALDALSGGTPTRGVSAYCQVPADPQDPIRIDMASDGAAIVAVVMPRNEKLPAVTPLRGKLQPPTDQ